MDIANLVLPVFAVILTGWLVGAAGYLPRTLAAPLVQFAYNVAMPALVFVTIAQAPLGALLDSHFLVAFGGGSMMCFAAVFLASRIAWRSSLGSSAMAGAVASMTNTGFMALPILQALYGQRGVLPAAIATVFVGAVMFPVLVILLEVDEHGRTRRTAPAALLKQVAVNPVMISTLSGLVWSVAGSPLPSWLAAYLAIVGEALTPCALFAVGLGLSLQALRGNLATYAMLTLVKLVLTPLVVYGLCVATGLGPFHTVAAVVCAAVPTAKTAYVAAGAYQVEEAMAGSIVSMTTLLSVLTLLSWIYALS